MMVALKPGQRINHRTWGLGTVLDSKPFPLIGSGEVIVEFDTETDYGDVVTVTASLCTPEEIQ